MRPAPRVNYVLLCPQLAMQLLLTTRESNRQVGGFMKQFVVRTYLCHRHQNHTMRLTCDSRSTSALLDAPSRRASKCWAGSGRETSFIISRPGLDDSESCAV